MSRRGDWIRLRRQYRGSLEGREEIPNRFIAQMGNGEGIVEVPGKGPTTVYVRIWGIGAGAGRGVLEVINTRVANRNDLYVFVGFDPVRPELLQVLEVYEGGMFSGLGTYRYVPHHHEAHELFHILGGDDSVFIQSQQLLPFLCYPTAPLSMQVNVYGGRYPWDTAYEWFETTISLDLTPYIPVVPGMARFVHVTIDGATGLLQYTSGTLFSTLLPPIDKHAMIPLPPAGSFAIAAIYLPFGVTSLDWPANIYDTRFLFGSTGGSVTPGVHNLLDSTVHQDTITGVPAQGYIVRGIMDLYGVEWWERYDASTDGAALVGDGANIISTLTPTWLGVHTHAFNVIYDDGVGDSPHLQFIGGSNDDLIEVYLADHVDPGRSDFLIILADHDGHSRFEVHSDVTETCFTVDSDGIVNTWGDLLAHRHIVLDDGIGDSPQLQFVGGSNDDTIIFFLDDDAVTGNSDLVLRLCAADDGSQFQIQDNTPLTVAYIDAAGNMYLDGHVAIGTAVDPDRLINAIITPDGTANTEGIFIIDKVVPTGNFATNHYALYFQMRLGAAFQQTAGTFAGVRGEVDIQNNIAGRLKNAMGARLLVDAEDGTIGTAQGARIYTPYADTGSITTGHGINITAGVVGAGFITNLYGLKINSVNAGVTNWAIHTSEGLIHFGDQVIIDGLDAADVQFTVEGAAAQADDLVRLQDNTTAILSRFNKDGYFMTRKIAAPADGDLVASELAFWFDSTNGNAFAMFKGKTVDGTVVSGSVALA